jgi:hypothetical protein
MEFILNSASVCKKKEVTRVNTYSFLAKFAGGRKKYLLSPKRLDYTQLPFCKRYICETEEKVFSMLNSVTWIGFDQNLAMLGHFGM